MFYSRIFSLCILLFSCTAAQANLTTAQLAVWANEAIVTTYTYSYENFIQQQKAIALYFTPKGWIAYSKAFQDAKLQNSIVENKYLVSAVATLPPTIKTIGNQQWQATMPLLVSYKNTQYQQKQTLNVTIQFTAVADGGVRGLAITNLQAKASADPCQCKNEERYKAIV